MKAFYISALALATTVFALPNTPAAPAQSSTTTPSQEWGQLTCSASTVTLPPVTITATPVTPPSKTVTSTITSFLTTVFPAIPTTITNTVTITATPVTPPAKTVTITSMFISTLPAVTVTSTGPCSSSWGNWKA